LENENELHELLEILGYIDRQIASDLELASEVSNILDQKLSRKNILVFLC